MTTPVHRDSVLVYAVYSNLLELETSCKFLKIKYVCSGGRIAHYLWIGTENGTQKEPNLRLEAYTSIRSLRVDCGAYTRRPILFLKLTRVFQRALFWRRPTFRTWNARTLSFFAQSNNAFCYHCIVRLLAIAIITGLDNVVMHSCVVIALTVVIHYRVYGRPIRLLVFLICSFAASVRLSRVISSWPTYRVAHRLYDIVGFQIFMFYKVV